MARKTARDILKIEIVVSVKKRKDVEVTPKFLQEAVMFWVDSDGGSLHGVKVKSVHWSHTRSGKPGSARTPDELEAVREKMLRRLLHQTTFTIRREMGSHQRTGAG